MKKIIFLLSLIFLGCNSKSEKFETEIVKLKHRNDSLQKIIDTLNTKYIFDDAMLIATPSITQKNKGGELNGMITIMAANKSQKILFSREFDYKKNKPINPDRLSFTFGYDFKIIRSKTDTIYYETIGKPKYGREMGKRYTDPLKYFQ
jgi:hypothetical protein